MRVCGARGVESPEGTLKNRGPGSKTERAARGIFIRLDAPSVSGVRVVSDNEVDWA